MYTHNEYLALSSRNVCIFNFVTRDSLMERNGISSARVGYMHKYIENVNENEGGGMCS